MMTKLTKMQHKVFSFICEHTDSEGFPPSYSDIAKHFNFASDGTVRTYLEHLEKKEYIRRLGKARGIQILKKLIPDTIPILGKIAAGSPLLSVEEYSSTIGDIEALKMYPGRYALTVQGDSMIDVGILDGDIAIIQTGRQVCEGEIAAVLLDDSSTLKRVYYEPSRLRLEAENPLFEPIFITAKEAEARILGKYIALVRPTI